jgi:hypothetical protein
MRGRQNGDAIIMDLVPQHARHLVVLLVLFRVRIHQYGRISVATYEKELFCPYVVRSHSVSHRESRSSPVLRKNGVTSRTFFLLLVSVCPPRWM